MLVLKRKPGQRLFIGEDIEIVVIEIDGQSVRLGINCPAEVSIMREELLGKESVGALPSDTKPANR